MTKRCPLTPELLRAILEYDPATGALTWRTRPREHFLTDLQCAQWNGRRAGRLAFTGKHSAGYFHSRVLGWTCFAHRVAWAIQTGAWPSGQIDHIDGDGFNNRFANLRDVSRTENQRNIKLGAANTSGVIGVYLRPSGCWTAQIKVHGHMKSLGTFRVFDDAVVARRRAEAEHGFHPNHGRRL